MTEEETDSGHSGSSLDSRITSRRPKRIIIAAVLAVVILLVDWAVLKWVVPWAHEHYRAVYGSGGYVVFYFTVFFTVISSLALMAYVFHDDSYPSDRWR